MFTGLIREIATIKSYKNHILSIKSKHKAKLGDSIAINGVCLTAVKLHDDGFDLELADETRATIDQSKLSGEVHLEPAMMMGDRFEGHIVQGHIDCTGTVSDIRAVENGTEFIIQVNPKYIAHIIPKGSITIDGISLTVNAVHEDSFSLMIIPHTLRHTLFRTYAKGSKLNIETDMFARYIDHILSHRSKSKSMSWSDIDSIQMGY